MTDAQPSGFNYDEEKVPEYTLPNLLDGIDSPDDWPRRRAEILTLFQEQMYGRCPEPHPEFAFEVAERGPTLDGTAERIQFKLQFGPKAPPAHLLLVLPHAAKKKPVPVFLGCNFHGNLTTLADQVVFANTSQVPPKPGKKAKVLRRGSNASRWPFAETVGRGYGLATIFCGDIALDSADLWREGVHADFPQPDPSDGGEWACISAWAWGLSRCLDVLQLTDGVDGKKVAVIGHSRLGKTALWAGARDERFAMVISNNSGCGGAALSRRRFGETVGRINTVFPHWFCKNFHAYNGREDDLPIDQHMLIALAAPRPVYVASASGDRWADPRGEFLAAREAHAVYKLFGISGLPVWDMPAPGEHHHGAIGFHLRDGRHNITAWDWTLYMDFADKHFGRQL